MHFRDFRKDSHYLSSLNIFLEVRDSCECDYIIVIIFETILD